MKPKNLSKKIRWLEARLQKGAKKLAKLKRKLEAVTKASVAKKKAKSAVRAGKGRKKVKTSGRAEAEKKNWRLAEGRQMQAAAVKRPGPAKKVKRKLNLTPERRAQLAAAMRARWAAKRAAAPVNTQDTSTTPGFTPGQGSQPQ
jgi:hypothetical protein